MIRERNIGRRSARASVAPTRSRRPSVEPLEGRVVLTGYAAASVGELVAAINAANLTAEADTITLAVGKTFTLAAVNNTADGPTGLPVIAKDGGGLTIVGNGDVIARSAAKGTPAFRLLGVAPGASLTLSNLTLQGGLAYGLRYYDPSGHSAQGGAVYNAGNLTLNAVVVQNNTAHGLDPSNGDYGGTQAHGGGIYSNGSLAVTGSTIRDNSAIGGRGSDGKVYDEYVALGGSHATGGGVCVAGGTASISNSTIAGNLAQGGAGGNITGLGKPSISDGTASGGGGGGLPYPGHPTAGTGGNGLGGGVYVGFGTLTVQATTVTGNSALGGAGGSGGKYRPDGSGGAGVGGGICIAPPPDATLVIDAYTTAHVVGNRASTKDDNIFIQNP